MAADFDQAGLHASLPLPGAPRRGLVSSAALQSLASAAPAVIAILAGLFAAARIPLGSPLADPFHEGEWLAHAGAVAEPGGFPVLTHGWLDIVPSRIAELMMGGNHVIVGTRIVNALLGGAGVGLFVACMLAATRPRSVLGWIAALPGLVFILLYGFAGESPVAFHNAPVNAREVALLVALLCCIRLLSGDDTGSARGRILALCAGLATGVGVFWCYDAGLAGLGVFATSCGVLLLRDRRVQPAFAAAGLALAFGLVGVTGAFGGIQGNVWNICYWSRYSGLWAYPVTPELVRHAVPAMAFIFLVLLLSALLLLRARQAGKLATASLLPPLMVMQVAFVEIGLHRADSEHLARGIMPGFLLLSACLACMLALRSRDGQAGRATLWNAGSGILLAGALFAADLCFMAYPAYPLGRLLALPWRANLQAMTSPAADDSFMWPDMRKVVQVMRSSAAACTYSLPNEGTVYLWTHKPPCSRFGYSAFIAPDFQPEAIRSLAERRPEVVLFDASDWPAHIDGENVWHRTPALTAWIAAHYPFVMKVGGYELRALHMQAGFSPAQQR